MLYTRSFLLQTFSRFSSPSEWCDWLRACTEGDVERALGLLNVHPLLLHFTPPHTQGHRGIHIAARCGHVALVVMLVERGESVNARTALGYTPLHLAATAGRKEVARQLIQLGTGYTRWFYDSSVVLKTPGSDAWLR